MPARGFLERTHVARQPVAFIQQDRGGMDCSTRFVEADGVGVPHPSAGEEKIMGEWLPIETAPKDGTVVIVWGYHEDNLEDEDPPQRRPWPARVSVQKHIWWLADGLRQVESPTHWMPLPPPPNEAQQS